MNDVEWKDEVKSHDRCVYCFQFPNRDDVSKSFDLITTQNKLSVRFGTVSPVWFK